MGETKNFKRGPDHHNPVNTGLPEEYIVLVGSPTNTFNGYEYADPRTGEGKPMPHPKNLKGLQTYIKGYPGNPAGTHDLYWANFLDPAARLFSHGIAEPGPKPGDIVTIAVYLKGYLWRQAIDWNASPHNALLHRNSPYVRGNPNFDPYAKFRGPSPPVPATRPREAFRNPSLPDPPKRIKVNEEEPEEVLNHHILMQTTSGNSAEAIKHPRNGHDYEDYIHDIPRKIVFGPMLGGTPQFPNVLVKLLLINDKETFANYLGKGVFPGEHWIHQMDKRTEEDMSAGARINDKGSFYDYSLAVSDKKSAIRWAKLFKTHAKMPNVDRTKIKVKRFDYIGHSADNGLYMIYGWGNQKGEAPFDEKFIEYWYAGDGFPPVGAKAFTRDASAWLWGCNLGKEYAPLMTDYFKKVVAAEIETDFTHILDTPSSMPAPDNGEKWRTYDRKSKRPKAP